MHYREISCMELNLYKPAKELKCNVWKKKKSDAAALDNHVCITFKQQQQQQKLLWFLSKKICQKTNDVIKKKN